jgi:hypothetical protein
MQTRPVSGPRGPLSIFSFVLFSSLVWFRFITFYIF